MPRNGELSKNLGVYKTLCCEAEIFIVIGLPFPGCPNHKNITTEWTQIPDVDPMRHQLNTRGKIAPPKWRKLQTELKAMLRLNVRRHPAVQPISLLSLGAITNAENKE